MYILSFIFIFFSISTYAHQSDLLSIKGNVTLSNSELAGEFLYTIKNDSFDSQDEWTFFINPNVHLLSISQNGKQARTKAQHGYNYKIITTKLPQKIEPNQQTTIAIRFAIESQHTDPRLTVSSNYVFLDARSFWFPTPVKDNVADFDITIQHADHLTSIMGGVKTANIKTNSLHITSWKNELPNISPNATLIIADIPSSQVDNIHVYNNNPLFQNIIFSKFHPFWKKAQSDHKHFPLSEIHIIPLSVPIPGDTHHEVEGEFIGNIFLINANHLDSLSNTQNTFEDWDSPSERIVETLIHELYHSFFPGIVKHGEDSLLFTESLVQYLTWGLINSTDPQWGKKIDLRTRFYLQNLSFSKSNPELHEFLWNTVLLKNASDYANLNSSTLADILIEKYRYVEYTPNDVFDTIAQHKQQHFFMSNDIDPQLEMIIQTNGYNISTNNGVAVPYDTSFFKAIQKNDIDFKSLNSRLQAKKTNFEVTVTNETFFKRKKTIQIPIDAIFLTISHDFPFTWHSTLSWMDDQVTNSIKLEIPQGDIWETNLTGNVFTIRSDSSFDLMEYNLANNYISQNNIGRALIYKLNTSTNLIDDKIIMTDIATKKLSTLRRQNHMLIWDSTKQIDDDLYIVNAFIVIDKKRSAFVSIPILKKGNQSTVYNILGIK